MARKFQNRSLNPNVGNSKPHALTTLHYWLSAQGMVKKKLMIWKREDKLVSKSSEEMARLPVHWVYIFL